MKAVRPTVAHIPPNKTQKCKNKYSYTAAPPYDINCPTGMAPLVTKEKTWRYT